MATEAAENRITPVSRQTWRRMLIIIFAILVLELSVGVWIYVARNISVPEIDISGVTVFTPPNDLPPFDLTDHDHRPFDNHRLRGRWTLAVFGYTSCPDFCPTTLAEMARLFNRLSQSPEAGQAPQFVFISVDPYRDTPEQLASYVGYFRPDFLGVTGEAGKLQRLNDSLGIHFEYADPDTNLPIRDVQHEPSIDHYIVDHYSGLLIVDPRGRLVATLLPPFELERTLDVYHQLRNHYEGAS
ncbi:MAG: SCO family protein [Gammaproteobacteria bacterium]|nr:SCO family protein [Gammaproteobacteria bacterium]